MVTQKELKEMFDLKDGCFYFKIKTHHRAVIGALVGRKTQTGYWEIIIKNKFYPAHHLVWLWFNGYIPEQLDHINHNRIDNKIENLRECTDAENQYNMSIHKDNKSGLKGVSFRNDIKKRAWRAVIGVNRKYIHLGYFLSKEEAAKAYNEAAIKHFGEFANLNVID